MAEEKRSRGVVLKFNDGKGFGFIKPNGADDEGDADLFVHFSDIQTETDGHRTLWSGQEVEFTVIDEDKGPKAVDVVVVDGGARRGGGRVGGYDRRNGNGYRGGGNGNECYNCGKIGHLSRDCDRPRNRNSGGGEGCYNCGEVGHISRDCDQNNGGSRRNNDGGCYTCGGVGHLARECPSGRNDGCYNCGGQGHIARECPSGSNRGNGNNSGFSSRFGGNGGGSSRFGSKNCYHCGKPGHIANNCPDSQQ